MSQQDTFNGLQRLLQQAGQQQSQMMQPFMPHPGIKVHQDNMTLMGQPGQSMTPGLDQWQAANPGYGPGGSNVDHVNNDRNAQQAHQLWMNEQARLQERINTHDATAKLAGTKLWKDKEADKQKLAVQPVQISNYDPGTGQYLTPQMSNQSNMAGAQSSADLGFNAPTTSTNDVKVNFKGMHPLDFFYADSQRRLQGMKQDGEKMAERGGEIAFPSEVNPFALVPRGEYPTIKDNSGPPPDNAKTAAPWQNTSMISNVGRAIGTLNRNVPAISDMLLSLYNPEQAQKNFDVQRGLIPAPPKVKQLF